MRTNQKNQQYTVELAYHDKSKVRTVMAQELALFNTLNGELVRMLRRDPKLLSALSDKTTDVVAAVIVEGFELRKMNARNKDTLELPTTLAPLREDLFATDKQILSLIENVVSQPTSIHKSVKRALTVELLKFYGNSARIAIKRSGSHEFLENLDETRKRHVQFPRQILEIEYDEAGKRSLIRTPYTTNRIVVPGVDITQDAAWKVLVLHQRPGKMPRPDTPWMIDLRPGSETYLLKYMEMANPYAGGSIHQSARSARSVVF